jgi:tRNA threonylcarbamoyladenosine biosynthesis protein TsaB
MNSSMNSSMKNVLAIETSGALCSVCLRLDGNWFSATEHVERRHNELLLSMLSEIREKAGLNQHQFAESVDAVAFGSGPGSFTGIRIAAAAAQAIALASSASVVRVPSSHALALSALEADSAVKGVITLIRSRRELFYLATYSVALGVPSLIDADRLTDAWPGNSWYEHLDQWLAAGQSPSWWQGRPVSDSVQPEAEHVLQIADVLIAAGAAVDAADALPEYLEGDTPWRPNG